MNRRGEKTLDIRYKRGVLYVESQLFYGGTRKATKTGRDLFALGNATDIHVQTTLSTSLGMQKCQTR